MALLLGAQCCQALLWATAGRASKCNQNFICVWCICNTTLEGLVVGANGGIGEVLQRNIEDDTCGTALFYCWQQGGGVCCITEVVAELQRVNQSRTVLDFAIKTNRSEEHTSELQSRFDLVC